jgi:hypothetical protein
MRPALISVLFLLITSIKHAYVRTHKHSAREKKLECTQIAQKDQLSDDVNMEPFVILNRLLRGEPSRGISHRSAGDTG